MYKIFKTIMVFTLFCAFSHLGSAKEITITGIYNNVPFNENLKTAWGISFFIEGVEKTIMFDTGGDGSILLSNMEKLKIDPARVELVILSHIHYDHVGGLYSFLKKNNKVTVYLPASFPDDFKNNVKSKTGKIVTVKDPLKICENVWSTGELGTSIKEQSLIIDTPEGLVVLTGCSHPGIVNIASFVNNYFKKNIYMILGGFHLYSSSESTIKKIVSELKSLKVKKIAPSHCTGEKATELFKEAWGKNFIGSGCGTKIKLSLDKKQQK